MSTFEVKKMAKALALLESIDEHPRWRSRDAERLICARANLMLLIDRAKEKQPRPEM